MMALSDDLVRHLWDRTVADALSTPSWVPEVTEEERADLTARAEARREALVAFWETLSGLPDPLAVAVVSLHSPAKTHDPAWSDCEGCDFAGWEAYPPEWPCRTIELVAARFGVEVPE